MFFLDIITHYRRGTLNKKINEKLAELTKVCRDTNKAGEITIKLKLKPSKSGGNEFTWAGSVTSKVPEQIIPEAIFFIDDKGNVTRDDPAQSKMFEDEDERAGVTSLDRARLDAVQTAISAG